MNDSGYRGRKSILAIGEAIRFWLSGEGLYSDEFGWFWILDGNLVHDLIVANLVDSAKESDSGYRDNQVILSEEKLSGT